MLRLLFRIFGFILLLLYLIYKDIYKGISKLYNIFFFKSHQPTWQIENELMEQCRKKKEVNK